MTSLKDFHRQRAKSVIPKRASTRRYRRLVRSAEGKPMERAFRGIMPRSSRAVIVKQMSRLHAQHNNVMDPFRFTEYRHPQARKLERAARRVAREVGWTIHFDARGVMHFDN